MFEKILKVQAAQDIATQQVPGIVEKVSMSLVYGVMVYKFYIQTHDGKRFHVEIDAKTGSVLRLFEKRHDD